MPKPGFPAPGQAREALRQKLGRISGKQFLLCSGGADELVPYQCSEPFLAWFKDAVVLWLGDSGTSVQDIVYPGVGHRFDWAMFMDAIRFVTNNVDGASVVAPRI